MTIHRSAGWLGFDTECDPFRRPGRSLPSCALSSPKWWTLCSLRSNRCCHRTTAAPARLPPPPRPRPVVLPRDPDPAVHRGRRGSTSKRSSNTRSPTPRCGHRRDEWIAAGVFDQLRAEALAAFDRIVGLDLTEVAIDGQPAQGPLRWRRTPAPTRVTGANRAGSGRSRSTVHGIPTRLGQSTAPTATTSRPVDPTLDAVAANRVCSIDIETAASRPRLRLPEPSANAHRRRPHRLTSSNAAPRTRRKRPQPIRLGLRWIVEATNSWLSNYGQLRRNTDRKTRHRHAALCLATTVLIVGKLSPTATDGAQRDRLSAQVLSRAQLPRRGSCKGVFAGGVLGQGVGRRVRVSRWRYVAWRRVGSPMRREMVSAARASVAGSVWL